MYHTVITVKNIFQESFGAIEKADPGPASFGFGRKLLLRGDRVFCGFRDAELHDRLRLDLYALAGLRIAPYARLTWRLHQTSISRTHQQTVLFGFLNSG